MYFSLSVGPPERSTHRNTWPVRPTGLIDPKIKLPPILTVVTWSKVGVPGWLALLDRIHQKLLPPSPAPINTWWFDATSTVPHTGEFGMVTGSLQVTPPSVDRLNDPPSQVPAGLHV